jgi:hypothetical protein
MRSLPVLTLLLAAGLVGCSDDGVPSPASVIDVGIEDGLPAECNPLRSAGACLLPYPSAIFLEPDASTATGQRMKLTSPMFPRNDKGVAYDPARLDFADGFSPSAAILAYFPERLDGASLPPITDAAQSLSPTSATVIVDMDQGGLVAHFAEVDAQVFKDEDRQSLILRPMTRLATGRRYAVAVTRTTRTLAGGPPASPPGWPAIADGSAAGGPDVRAAAQAARMPAIFAALEQAGVAKADVLLAWDFVTASDAGLTASLSSMREQTLAAIGSDGLGFTIASVEDEFSEHALRRVRGTFTVPRFLTQTDISVADAVLLRDEHGVPKQDGTYEAPFTLILPRSAATGPVKLLLFGHGFLGSGEGELGDASGSYMQRFADERGYALIATDWAGLSKYEGTDAAGSGAAAKALQDINGAPWIGERLQQAIINAVVLARTARQAIARDPALFVGGAQVVDDTRIDYYGISLGGVMGSCLMGFSPDLERGVLNVGAAGWSTLFQRSTNWLLFKLFLDVSYPDRVDQQIILEIMQASLDPVDGMSIARHVLVDPLPGNPAKQVLLQMAVHDAQVPNIASEMAARTLELPLLSSSPKAVYGMTPVDGPQKSAFTIWDTHEEPTPLGNVSASVTVENTAHGDIRALPALMDQIDVFFRTGDVVSTCDGVCDPE